MKTYLSTSEIYADRYAVELYGISESQRVFRYEDKDYSMPHSIELEEAIRKAMTPSGVVNVCDVDLLKVSGG